MGRHGSRKQCATHEKKKSKRKSSNSSSEEYERSNRRLERLERLVEQLDRCSRPRSRTPLHSRVRSRSRSHSPPPRRSRSRLRSRSRSRSYSRSRVPRPSVRQGDEQLIPIYDPGKEELVIEQWVSHVDELATRYDWDDRTVMRLIASRLKGHARQWYDTRQPIITTWKETKDLLTSQFRKIIPFAKLFKDAANYEAKTGQSLGDYCFQKSNKLRKLDISIPEEYQIDIIIGGINDEALERTIRSAQRTTVNELYAYMNTLGDMPRREEPRQTITSKNSTKHGSYKYKNDSNTVINKNKTNVAKTLRGACYNCGIAGHVAKDCKKPRLECTKCKFLGHRQENCPRTKEVNEVAPVIKSTLNIYERKVRISGHKINGLIDTGSACTLVRSSVAKTLRLITNSVPPVTLKGFAGHTITADETACIMITVMDATATVNALVIADEYLAYDVLIGRDFLNQEHIITIKRGKELIIKQTMSEDRGFKIAQNINFCDVSTETTLRFGNVDEITRNACTQLIKEYDDCVSSSLGDLGKTDAAVLEIKCMTDEPIAYRPYRLAEPEKKIVRDMIQELLKYNIIRESDSPYASPITLVLKRTGDHRMCVDFRKLNAITIKDKYPLPLIDDQIDKLGGNKYFTGLDLASGYYQVPVGNDSIAKTAFVTPEGHYEFLRMPFGLTNAPSVFQRLMDKVLGHLKNSIAFPYLDDVIIPSKTIEEGLRQVLEKLRLHKLTLKLNKCSFFETSIEYLGREISAEGVKPGQRKIQAMMEMEPPQTIKQVRQFLGLGSYFRKFIKDFAIIVEPLTRLLRKNEPWKWTDQQTDAFNCIKEKLTTRPILSIFDPTKHTELHTDASSLGVGAMLLQKNKDGLMTVVAYYSKQTTADQRCYHSYELETMAVVFALRYFRVYLLGLKFKIITDCNALRTTFTKKDLLPRIGRWWLETLEFTFEIGYRAGTRMAHVDALSRNPIKNVLEVTHIDVTESEWIIAAQLQDEQLQRIRDILSAGERTNETKHYFDEYRLKNNKIYRRLPNGRDAWVVPRTARLQICRLCHDDAGHLSVEKTLERIRDNYWFAKMRRFVTKYVTACLNCAYYKNTMLQKQGKLNVIEKVPVPFHTLHIDHVGPFETSRKCNKYIFVIVDAFTKFTIIEPVKSQKTRYVVKTLTNLSYLFGTPTRIISDRGTAFTSKTFNIFCITYGIKHVLNAVATPRANGQCERYNRTIVNALATTVAGKDPRDWDLELKQIQCALNTAHNKSINTTPMKALIGHEPKPPVEARILNAIQEGIERLDLSETREKMAEYITKQQAEQKERYDRTRREARKYKQGELILVQVTSEAATGTSRKLNPKFRGPFRIRAVLPNDRYEVEDMRENAKRTKTVVAADRIKPWIVIQADDE